MNTYYGVYQNSLSQTMMTLTLLIWKNVLSHNLKFIYNFPEQNTSNIKYIPLVRGQERESGGHAIEACDEDLKPNMFQNASYRSIAIRADKTVET